MGISRVPCCCTCSRHVDDFVNLYTIGNNPPFDFARTVRSGGSFFRRGVCTPLPLASTPWQPMQPFSYSSLPGSILCWAGAVALILSAATSTKMLRTARIIGSSQTNPGFFRWEDNATEPTLIEPALQSLML